MNKENDEKLCRDFPLLYRDRHSPMGVTCMCWGFACGDGWFDALYRASAKLETLIALQTDECSCGPGHPKHDGDCDVLVELGTEDGVPEMATCACAGYEDGRARAFQVKEKFGGIRTYLDGSVTKEMDDVVSELERECWQTCEDCGSRPAKVHNVRMYLKTQCEPCVQEREKACGQKRLEKKR